MWWNLALSLAMLFSVGFSQTQADDLAGGPLVEQYDLPDVLTTWRHIANEQVIFPLDMAEFPVRIDRNRQLLVDNYFIATAKNVSREVHRPRRYEGNPIVVPEPHDPKLQRRDNRVVCKFVMRFDEAPRYRMWYWGHPDWHAWKDGHTIRFGVGYAISDDGKNWQKPNLDMFLFEGSNLHNLVMPYGLMHGLFYEPDEPDPQKRFKALINVETGRHGNKRDPVIPTGYYLHTSPDGIHWTGNLEKCDIPTPQGMGYVFPPKSIGDTSRFWWDSLRQKYVGDVKFVLPGTNRVRGVMESDDLVHWTRPTPTFHGLEGDNQIYGHRGFIYQGMYIGMRWVYVKGRSRAHSSYVELDCSRDGQIWTRVGAKQPFMAFNPKKDTWDAGKMRPIAMFEEGDEVWIYYNGMPTDAEMENPDFPESQRVGNSIGLAILPRDRFASINGGDETGALVTRPLDFDGSTLHINGETAEGGQITVALMDRSGKAIEGFGHGDCQPLQGDSLDMQVGWQNGSDLAAFNQSEVRLEFHLDNAKLYSFWVD